MKIQAVIFDVYQTLLEVTPPAADTARRWRRLWAKIPGNPRRPGLVQFNRRCDEVIRREHLAVRRCGVPWPEVFWPAVVQEAFPALRKLGAGALDDWLFDHARIVRAVRLAPGAGEVLRGLGRVGVCLGVASNAQPYTRRELEAALAGVGLGLALFQPDLCFWSFAHGFSKPDPHVFRLLTIRLLARGIPAGAALVVGDRADNDLEPARRAGWQTWRLEVRAPEAPSAVTDGAGTGGLPPGGDWRALARHLGRHLAAPAGRRFEVALSERTRFDHGPAGAVERPGRDSV